LSFGSFTNKKTFGAWPARHVPAGEA